MRISDWSSDGCSSDLQPPPELVVGQGEKHQSRIGGDLLHDAVEMDVGPDHRPEMAHRLHILERADGRLGDILQRLASGVRKQVEMADRKSTRLNSSH